MQGEKCGAEWALDKLTVEAAKEEVYIFLFLLFGSRASANPKIFTSKVFGKNIELKPINL